MTKYFYLWLTLTVILSTPNYARANNSAGEIEIGGLLLDNTKSRLGHDFYYEFSQLWRDIPNTQGINTEIIEQLVPRAGTRLSLKLNSQTIYVTHFGRRQTPVKEKVEQAILIFIDAMKRTQYSQESVDMADDGW